MRKLAVVCWLIASMHSLPAMAKDYFGNPANYLNQLRQLQPGDRLLLEPGVYERCLPIDGLHGTETTPITIEGPALNTPARFVGAPCINSAPPRASVIVRIQDSSHLHIRNLELDGEGLGVVGVQAGYGWPSVHNILIEGLYIHDNDTSQQITAISCFTTAWDWVIRKNRIERVGLGMYLGNSDGSDPFIRGVIEENLILDPIGYGIQIKHQNIRNTEPGMPTSDSSTLIRHNVIMKRSNSSTGFSARPNLLVGHFPRSGVGEFDRYQIYGNFLFENQSDEESLFQGEGNISFHDNVLFNNYRGPGIWVAPHNDVPKSVRIYRNTIVTRAWGLAIMGGDSRFRQWAIGNAIFSSGVMATDIVENVIEDFSDANMYLNQPGLPLSTMDLHPAVGGLLGTAIDWSSFSDDEDWINDFNGESRPVMGVRRGAYSKDGQNLGWKLADEFKELGINIPPILADAGVTDSGFIDSGAELPETGHTAILDAEAPAIADAEVNLIDASSRIQDVSVTDSGPQTNDTRSASKHNEESCSCATISVSSEKSTQAIWFLILFGVLRVRYRLRERCE